MPRDHILFTGPRSRPCTLCQHFNTVAATSLQCATLVGRVTNHQWRDAVHTEVKTRTTSRCIGTVTSNVSLETHRAVATHTRRCRRRCGSPGGRRRGMSSRRSCRWPTCGRCHSSPELVSARGRRSEGGARKPLSRGISTTRGRRRRWAARASSRSGTCGASTE